MVLTRETLVFFWHNFIFAVVVGWKSRSLNLSVVSVSGNWSQNYNCVDSILYSQNWVGVFT